MSDQCRDGAPKNPIPNARFSNIARQHFNALTIMRCYFASHAQCASFAWEAGMDVAIAAFGKSDGPSVAWACMDTVRAMRLCRTNVFQFKNPFCPCCQQQLTQHEGYMLDCLEAAEAANKSKLRIAAMLLCEGNNDDPFVQSVFDLDGTLFHRSPDKHAVGQVKLASI
ncbi:MAG: hypothetical protein U5K75_08360 [Ahrensia sp.]|nr:hypothetical protein [Ahrensia sp.]